MRSQHPATEENTSYQIGADMRIQPAYSMFPINQILIAYKFGPQPNVHTHHNTARYITKPNNCPSIGNQTNPAEMVLPPSKLPKNPIHRNRRINRPTPAHQCYHKMTYITNRRYAAPHNAPVSYTHLTLPTNREV